MTADGAVPDPVDELARRYGITDSYVDARGERHETSGAIKTALLDAMGCQGEAGALNALAELDRREWQRPLPPVTVHRSHGPPAVLVSVPAGTLQVEWRAMLENGPARSMRTDSSEQRTRTWGALPRCSPRFRLMI